MKDQLRVLLSLDVVNEKRVDTINNFDNVTDYDSRGNQSKFLKLQNRKLTDYNECRTNRVLIHDDISTNSLVEDLKMDLLRLKKLILQILM